MRQAGRYLPEYRRLRDKHSFLDLCRTPEAAAQATLQPLKRFDLDAAILFSDILLPLAAMGLEVGYGKGGPRVGAGRLHPMDPGQDLGYVLETIRLVRRELDGRVPLIGFSGAPFTLASYIIEGGPSKDLLKTRAFMRAEPAAWKRLMSLLSAACGRYLEAQAAAGAQALQVFDTWVGVLSKEEYVRGVKPYSSRVLAAAAASGVPVIHFGTGNAAFLEDFADAGGDVVSVDWRLPLDEAWRRVGRRALQGNLDPACLLLPRKELGKTVADVLRRAAGRPGHIFNLGHGISPETPPENVRVVVDLVHGAARQ